MEVSVRYILNVFWKVHFSGWVPLPCFGKPWNAALMVWWSKSDVISNVKILIRPIRVLMASAGGPHRAVPRREGMRLEWLWSPLWVWAENAGYLGNFCNRSGMIMTTTWLRLCSGKGSKRQRGSGPSSSCRLSLCLAGCWLSLLGSTDIERECFCSLFPSNLGNSALHYSLLSLPWCALHVKAPGSGCVFDLMDPKGKVNM